MSDNRFGVLLVALALSTSACAAGRQMDTRAQYISEHAERIHPAAVNCAEREIAMAESHLDFGMYEMERGNRLPAEAHLEVAYENIDAAIAIVDAHPECWPDFVADTDGDGYLDDVDACVYDPEDFDNWEDEDGCPEPDNDFDEILDLADSCPNDPEDYDLWEDEDGCPDLDNDGDGYADLEDDCPNDPEDFDGNEDEDGCPEEEAVYEFAEVIGEQINITEQIHFATASARILPESFHILNDVSAIMFDHPSMEVRIEGHTDSDGSASYNQTLSDDRAASVRAYLIDTGIRPGRMISLGFGEGSPIDTNETSEGKANNRRVEFHITQW